MFATVAVPGATDQLTYQLLVPLILLALLAVVLWWVLNKRNR